MGAAEVLAHGGINAHDVVPLVVVGGGALVVLAGYVRGGRRDRTDAGTGPGDGEAAEREGS